MPTGKKEWYVIVNPHAGSGHTMPKWAVAKARMDELSIGYVSVETDHKFHAEELAQNAASQGFRKFLPVGGDGSLHETVKGIMRFCETTGTPVSEFLISIIPIGSGNDWVRSLGNSHDTLDAVNLLVDGRAGRQDIIRLTDAEGAVSYMVNIGGIGFDSDVCVRVNAQKDMGQRSSTIYFNALVHTIKNLKRFHSSVRMDGEQVFDGETYSIAFGNGRYSGGGLRQTSMSEMDDGLMDILIVPKVSLLQIVFALPRLFTGTIHKTRCLIYKRCRVMELTADTDVRYELDGEVEGTHPIRLEVTGQQINVLLKS